MFRECLDVFNGLRDLFEYVIVPYYSIVGLSEHEKFLISKEDDIKWILSSIMLDDYLLKSGIHDFFMFYADELKADYVLVWDMPTYLNDYHESFSNTIRSLDCIRLYIKKGYNVIPLIKDAHPEHIRLSVSNILDMGFKYAAFHVSEYLSNPEKPWPYIKDFSISNIEYMIRLIDIILESDLEEILIIG